MNALLYLQFVSLFTLDWLTFNLGIFGRVATWFPEIVSVVAMVLVLFMGATRKTLVLPFKYGLFLFVFLLLTVGWTVVNGVSVGALLAGMRSYLKYLPFFLLPIVYKFSERQMRRQLLFLLVLSLMQLPVAVYQRFVMYAGLRTGDVVGGTLGLNTSGVLSVYLACAIAVTVAFYAKRQIRLRTVALLATAFAIPTMLNETKITALLLPAAVLVPLLLGTRKEGNLRKAVPVILIGIMLGGVFLYMYEQLRGTSIIDFYTDEQKVEKYLYTGVDPRIEAVTNRFDSIALAVRQLNHDGNLLLGVGAGNASVSFSDKLTGEYYKKYQYLAPGIVYLSKVLWELGLIGVFVYGALFAMVALDAMRLRWRDDIVGALALGWIPVSGFIAASFVYFNTFDVNLFGYMYWYFAGYLISERFRERTVQSFERVVPLPDEARKADAGAL